MYGKPEALMNDLSTRLRLSPRAQWKAGQGPGTRLVRWYNVKHREGMCACFQEKYYKVCIVRTAVN